LYVCSFERHNNPCKEFRVPLKKQVGESDYGGEAKTLWQTPFPGGKGVLELLR